MTTTTSLTGERASVTPEHLLVFTHGMPAAKPVPTTPLVFIDTETTSLHHNCRIWEVAMIARHYDQDQPNPGSYTEQTMQLFIDIDVSHADPYALQLGGYWDRHPAGRRQSRHVTAPGGVPSPSDLEQPVSEGRAARLVAGWTHGAHLVAVNPSFDAERLGQMLRRHGLFPGWSHHLLDVLAVASGHLRLPPPWRSDDLAAALGVTPAGADRHTALGDARWAARIYDAVYGAPTQHDDTTGALEARP
ncbi:hypothetical protein GCM10009737_08060 [Nocardioides lentus]|uniref:Exonuclease domain-containing protein n=1 Tax=Nocardioides lentus TaxID=338077 RepID=A0ABN2P0Q6_9ACTN